MKQKYSGSTASSAPAAAAWRKRRKASLRLASRLMPETIWMAATFIRRFLLRWANAVAVELTAARAWARVGTGGERTTLSTCGSAQVPLTRNSWVAALCSGWRNRNWARNVPSPTAGLMAEAISEAVPALSSGTTTTLRSCVSRESRPSLPSARRR
jgi:hypothetical protein